MIGYANDTVGELRAALAGLPDDAQITVRMGSRLEYGIHHFEFDPTPTVVPGTSRRELRPKFSICVGDDA